MRIQWVAGVLLACAATAGCAADSAVTIRNDSSWQIHQLYLSPTAEEEWGSDQLRDDIIDSGAAFTLQGIPCNEYDVRLVDEDEDVCVVEAVPLCADQDQWVINDDDLLACQAETDEE